MVLLRGVAPGVGHEEAAFVECDSLRFIAHLGCCNHLEGLDVNLCYKAFIKILETILRAALVAIARDVDKLAVATKFAIVGYILCGSHGLALRSDELYDVRPVDGNGNEVVINLDDVVGRVTQLLSVHVAEPLVAHHMVVLKVGQTAIVCLPHTFVQ